jgi:hypothetical protein
MKHADNRHKKRSHYVLIPFAKIFNFRFYSNNWWTVLAKRLKWGAVHPWNIILIWKAQISERKKPCLLSAPNISQRQFSHPNTSSQVCSHSHKKYPLPSPHQSAPLSTPSGQISEEYDTGHFHANLSRNSCLKSDKSARYRTRRPVHFIVASDINLPHKHSWMALIIFMLLTACSSTLHTQCTALFPHKQWLCTHQNVIVYIYFYSKTTRCTSFTNLFILI